MRIRKDGQLESQAIPLSEEELNKINQMTRRAFKTEELFVFRVALCDNEIDRDYERFSDEALEELQRLFVGKTGICDHDPKSENQQARIYEAAVIERPGVTTSYGMPYRVLEGKAYMVRTEGNRDLILEIEGGIKKEVSVGCAMKEALCSVCGQNRQNKTCEHIPGSEIEGEVCHTILNQPMDAYEWSFVAVPAQKNAGVMKQFGRETQDVWKALERGQAIYLSDRQAKELGQRMKQLEQDCSAIRRQLRREALVNIGPLPDSEQAEHIIAALDRMSIPEMKAFGGLLAVRRNEKPIEKELERPQITAKRTQKEPGDRSFMI